jgi:ectoine hydroxylase-related dioxygenase (phytanoyl-CoA dioxygenase family)
MYSAAMTGSPRDFRRDGACVVRGCSTRTRSQRWPGRRAQPGRAERARDRGRRRAAGRRFFEDFRNWDADRAYEAVIRGSRIGEVAARADGLADRARCTTTTCCQGAGTTIRTPWHQDQPYYNIDGSRHVSFWIPLDPVPRESTLEFVAGSHASRTWYMPRSFFDDRALVFEEGAFGEVPDVEADRAPSTILGWALEPGDAVAFNMLTLHAAAGSRNAPARVLGAAGRRRRRARRAPARDQPAVPGAGWRAGGRRRARPLRCSRSSAAG